MRFFTTKIAVTLTLLLFTSSLSAQILLRGVGNLVSSTPPPPSTTHPHISMTLMGVSPTVTELQTRLGTGGPQASQFQSFLDIYCKTAANGGVLDTFVASYSPVYGLWIYGFIIATYPVTGANYQDCSSLSVIETPFFSMFDTTIAAGYCGFGCAQWDAIAKAYDWGYNSLSPARRSAAETWLAAAVDLDMSAGPYHHRRSTASLQYHYTGYLIDDAPRIALRPSVVTDDTGIQTAETFQAGVAGGEPAGLGYFLTELDWHGMGMLSYADGYRTTTGDGGSTDTGTNTVLEYYPLWLAHLIYPYRPSVSGFAGFMWAKTSETVDTLTDPTNYPYAETFIPPFLKNIARIYETENASIASLAQYLFNTLFYSSGSVIQSTASIAYTNRHALWGNYLGYNTVTPMSPTTLGLPTNQWFNKFGSLYMRDCWTIPSGCAVVGMDAPPYKWINSGYMIPTSGSFTIHRNGPLVINPGSGAHSTLQEQGWGGNTVVFPKPSETRGSIFYWDMGGARPSPSFSTADSTTDFVAGTQWDIGGFKTDGCGGACARIDLNDDTATHKYSYVYTNLTRAYNSTLNHDSENSIKISNFERQLFRFPPTTPGTTPGYTWILDHYTTTGTDVEPRWQMYVGASTTPTTKTMTISNSTVACNPAVSTCTTRNGVESWDWLGTCGTMYGTISYTGVQGLSAKAYWQPLLPSSCKIIERGGPNGSGLLGQTDSHEWEDPYGHQGGNIIDDGPGVVSHTNPPVYYPWEGSYKYELLAQTTVATGIFSNVITDVETSSMAPTNIVALSGTNTTGVRIDDTDAHCGIAKNVSGTLTTGDFVLATVDTFTCVIATLPASTAITFTKGANVTSITLISNGDTDLTYTSTAQGTLWLSIVVGSAGSGAGNTISW